MFQINIDPESLKPKLPSRKDLRPYPTTCYLEYRGHTDAVMSVSVEPSGQWIASGAEAVLSRFNCSFTEGTETVFTIVLINPVGFTGSMDGTVRVWEIETGRCLRVWSVDEAVKCVTWNPVRELPILAISV